MLAALVIVFREALEAGLVIGVVLAATQGVAGRGRWIGLGLAAGVAGACIVAAFAGRIGAAFEGAGQEALNAGILLVAVAMLAWHNAWMARHGREWSARLKQVGREVQAGTRPLAALGVVCGMAVLREGSEVALFLSGVALTGGASALSIVTGGLLGILLGALASVLLYAGLISLPVRHLFTALTALITLVAAGLAAQAVSFLQQGGWIQILSDPVWDTSNILSQDGVVGRVLHTLIGYSDRPSGLDLVAYGVTVLLMVLLMRVARQGAAPGGGLPVTGAA